METRAKWVNLLRVSSDTFLTHHAVPYLKEAFAAANLANWALVLVGIAAALLAWRTLRRIDDQAKSGRDAATAALLNAQAIINAERAWVMAELSAYGDALRTLVGEGYETGKGLYQSISVENVKLTLRNLGKTPAWIDNVRAQVDIVDATSVRNEPGTAWWNAGFDGATRSRRGMFEESGTGMRWAT